MNRKQNYNQNQQRSNHNPNSSTSNDRSRNSLWINRNDPDRNSTNNNIIIGAADPANSERNRMRNSVPIRGNQASRRHPLNPEQNSVAIPENLASRCDCVSMCAMTVKGSECLQRMLAADGGGGLRETILAELAADLPILMVHEIGFEFVRAFFLSCDERQMDRVLQLVLVRNKSAFDCISNNYFGQAIKALIQNLKNEAQLDIVTNVLQDYILSFTNYEHGQNVLHFFIYTCNHDFSRTRLFNVMTNNCLAIATNELGCRILQCLLCPMFRQGGLIISLIDTVVANVFVLAKDKYGSYLVQHVIDANNMEGVTKRIVGELMGRICELAKSQFGSIVVQKCLKKCEQSEVVKIVEEFTNSSQLPRIAQHRYGHYVIRCAFLHVANRGTVQHYRNLVDGINLHAPTLKDHPYGRKVIRKINELNSMSPFLFPQ